MNWSTWQLKEKPFYLKAGLTASVPLSLEAARRRCWVFAPSLASLSSPSGQAVKKMFQERVMWPGSLDKRWGLQWQSVHGYPALCSPDFHRDFCPPARCPAAVGGGRPTTSGFPRSWQERMMIFLLAGCQIPALQGPHLMQWPPGMRQAAPEGLDCP